MISTTLHSTTIFQEKIDVHSQIEVGHWCQRLNCSKEQLTYCIMKVGNSSRAVEDFWQMNRDRLQAFFHIIWQEAKT
jgi:hypothetical protein